MRWARSLACLLPWGLVAGQGWLISSLVKRYGQALLERDRLQGRLAVVMRATGDTADEVAYRPARAEARRLAVTTQQVGYQQLQDEAIRTAPPYPARQFGGAGIVIVAGGPRYYTNAWVGLTMLRRVLGCRLPIQLWYLGPTEMSPRMIELLRPFDVECVDALQVHRRHPMRALGGWECKPYAILHSPFKEVIFLDADNVPLIDPAALLTRAEYRATGAIFWPDFTTLGRHHPIWEICRAPYRDEPEFESGQIVVDKERCWAALHLALHLNEQSEFYYKYVYGDKETFHMAWRMLDQPYSMPSTRPAWGFGSTSRGNPGYAEISLQHDFDGRAIFQHRTGAKWTAWGENFRLPGFEHHDVCLEALRELRRQWDGTVEVSPRAVSSTALEADLIRSRYFLYRRVGSDERALELLPGGRIGDGRGPWERAWRLEEQPGGPALVIQGYDSVTCRLARSPDGHWSGSWLHSERLPVELIPLGGGAPACEA